MQYIEDPEVFKAVSFASSMIKDGKPIGLSIYKAACYYEVPTKEVARHLGKRGAEKAKLNKFKNKWYDH